MILNDWVIDPTVGKTVSYLSVSTVIVTRASGELMKDSFLQESSIKREKDKRSRDMAFIMVKNNAYSAEEIVNGPDKTVLTLVHLEE
jgi:hypothetical protein